MFTVATFTIAKTWKQFKCLLTEEWRKTWYTYTMEDDSAIKKEWNNAICSNMDGPRKCHTEVRWVRQRRRNILWHPSYVQSKKKCYKWIHKTERESQAYRMNLWLLGERTEGRDSYGVWITNKDLCIAHGTLLNVMWQPGWDRSLGENGYMSPFAVYLKLPHF